MSRVTLEIAFILVLIIANGVFAMAEAAVIAARKVRLQQRANEGDPKAQRALELANHPHDFLATVQIGITLVGILAGAFGGATIAEQLAIALEDVIGESSSEAVSLGLVVLIITYLSLVIGELVPKNLALAQPENIASLVARPMSLISKLVRPFVLLLNASTNLVLRLLGSKPSPEPFVTEEEIRVMIEQGAEAGTFEEAERHMIGRVFDLADLRVDAMMTPRTEIVWFETDDTPDEIRAKLLVSRHSRFPVCEGGLDKTLGIVHAADLLVLLLEGQSLNLTANLRPPVFVPETTPASQILETFKKTGNPVALVIDEYGGVQGLVTLTNLLEEMVGDVTISAETIESQVVQRTDGSWLIDGLLAVHHLAEILNRDEVTENDGLYQTLGGLVMAHLGHIPHAGEYIEAYGYRFEVVDMDGHRVDKILVSALPAKSGSPAI